MPPDSGVSGTSSIAGASRTGAGRTDDWASFVTAKIELVVSAIRDKAVNRISMAVHYAIFGIVAITVGSVLLVLFALVLVRVLDAELFHADVWASYFSVAGIFTLLGVLCVWLRNPRT